jgi:hypothetical protein
LIARKGLRKPIDNLINGDSVRLTDMTHTALTQAAHQQAQRAQLPTSRLQASRSTSRAKALISHDIFVLQVMKRNAVALAPVPKRKRVLCQQAYIADRILLRGKRTNER